MKKLEKGEMRPAMTNDRNITISLEFSFRANTSEVGSSRRYVGSASSAQQNSRTRPKDSLLRKMDGGSKSQDGATVSCEIGPSR